MLHREKAIASLTNKAELFKGYEAQQLKILESYQAELSELGKLSQEELHGELSSLEWPGALPTSEQDQYSNIVVPFQHTWDNHEQARAWALEVIEEVPTIAVDGSQITPSKELSIPVGAVQIGWFINPHDKSRAYVKDIEFEVLAPDELSDLSGDTGFPNWRVNMQRFRGECETLISLMKKYCGESNRPVCFFDGSLIVSFVQHMQPDRQRTYVQAINKLLDASKNYQIPLVGYTDTSYAKDLTVMLDIRRGASPQKVISDGALLRSNMDWGDRTIAYICARDDDVLPFSEQKYYQQMLFVYLKSTSDRPPARLDLPRWILEEGLLDYTLDVVRAECVIGNGYPYTIETADAVAVLTHQDRDRFYRLFQEFAQKEALPLRFSKKSVSKRGRRT